MSRRRRSRLGARGGRFALCPVRSRQRSRHPPSLRLSAAGRGHFEDGTRPGELDHRGVRFRVWRGTGTVRQGQASPPAAVGSGARDPQRSQLSCLSLWLRCRVAVARRGAVVQGPTSDGPTKRPRSLHDPEASRLPPGPAENCHRFRAPFTSASVRSLGVVSDFPGRGE